MFPLKLIKLWRLNFMGPYFCCAKKRDTFFFLTHRYYLSRFLTLAQRIDCAIDHYGYEARNYGTNHRRAVYESRGGLLLWQRDEGDTRSAISLCATEDERHEGDLSVLCLVNETRVCRVSFSYVHGSILGIECASTMFVTRNQTDRNSELQIFRKAFKQNSPPYFCLAAVCGIAMANGMKEIHMIEDDAQIAFDSRYVAGFRNSYSALWCALGAVETGNPHAYRMPIPMQPRPLSAVQSRHKSRARARRRYWTEIMASTREAMLEGRTSEFPSPIEPTDSALLELPHRR